MIQERYSEEFKSDAAKLVREQGYSVKKAAKSLGVDPGSIRIPFRKTERFWMTSRNQGRSIFNSGVSLTRLSRGSDRRSDSGARGESESVESRTGPALGDQPESEPAGAARWVPDPGACFGIS